MAENSFQEVMAQFKRMCQYYQSRGECPMNCLIPGLNISQCRKEAFYRTDFVEKVVMAWAAEHPEPVLLYPPWAEWLYDTFKAWTAKNPPRPTYEKAWFDFLRESRVPEDIARKLGIQPREETHVPD